MKMADIADKDLWVSKFKGLTAELEDVTRQKAQLAQSHKWSEIESLPTPEKLVYDTWTALPDSYRNMKTYAFGVLSIFWINIPVRADLLKHELHQIKISHPPQR